jgi:hypothetical protein
MKVEEVVGIDDFFRRKKSSIPTTSSTLQITSLEN